MKKQVIQQQTIKYLIMTISYNKVLEIVTTRTKSQENLVGNQIRKGLYLGKKETHKTS